MDTEQSLLDLAQRISELPSITFFIKRLFLLLHNKAHRDVLVWAEDGNSFKVLDKESFKDDVLAMNFHSRKLDTFIRSLYMYDFCKVKNDTHLQFRHPSFKRGEVTMLTSIIRKTNKTYVKKVPKEALVGKRPRRAETPDRPDKRTKTSDPERLLTFCNDRVHPKNELTVSVSEMSSAYEREPALSIDYAYKAMIDYK